MELIGTTHKYNNIFIPTLLIIQWSQDCQVMLMAFADFNTLYIQSIYTYFDKLFVYLETSTSHWHKSIANLAKRIHNVSRETVVYVLFIGRVNSMAWCAGTLLALHRQNEERVEIQRKIIYKYIEKNKNKTTDAIWQQHTCPHWAGCHGTMHMYMRKLFRTTWQIGWKFPCTWRTTHRDNKDILTWYSSSVGVHMQPI